MNRLRNPEISLSHFKPVVVEHFWEELHGASRDCPIPNLSFLQSPNPTSHFKPNTQQLVPCLGLSGKKSVIERRAVPSLLQLLGYLPKPKKGECEKKQKTIPK